MSTADPLPPSPEKSRSRRRVWLAFAALGCLAIVAAVLLWPKGTQAPPPQVPGEGLVATDAEIATAIEAARAEVFQKPNSAAAWGKLGQVLQVHNFLEPALNCYAEAERLDARNPNWPYFRGTIYQVGVEPARAIPELRRAAELGGAEQLPRLRLSEILLDQGQIDEAAEVLQKVLAEIPNSPRGHIRFAQVAAARQDWKECLRHLDAAGDAPFARKQMSSLRLLAYQRLGHTQAAEREQRALAQLPDDPKWPDALLAQLGAVNVGMMARLRHAEQLMRTGQVQNGLTLLVATVCNYPQSDASWTAMGKSFAIVGNYPAAEDALLKAIELAPDTADIWLALGLVRQRAENPAGALECYQKAIRLKPTDAEAHYNAGECLAATGSHAAAREEYREALKYRPDYPEAKERLSKPLPVPQK